MQTVAANLQLREAACHRGQIQALGIMQSNQFIDSKNPNSPNDIDLFALAVSDGLVCVYWVSIRGGRHVGDKSFFPDIKDDPEPSEQDYAKAFATQHYLGKGKPDVIISNFAVPDTLKEALEGEHGKQMQFMTKTIDEHKIQLKMAEQNAQMAIAQYRLQQSSQQHRIDELVEILNMNSDNLSRLEYFDISHTQDEATITSCVVYDEQNIQPSQCRRYNITTAKPGDDYAAMRGVFTRHYDKVQEAEVNGETVKWPGAILISGGKERIGIAVSVWEELRLHAPLVGIAKGSEHKAGMEELILPFTDETFRLPPNSPALHLLQTVRGESHRFAIADRRKERDRARATSPLGDIPGVGSKRRQALLTRFGGLHGVVAANKEDLEQVKGTSRALAKKIYEYLH